MLAPAQAVWSGEREVESFLGECYAVVALSGHAGNEPSSVWKGGDGVPPAQEEYGPGLILHYRIPAYLEGHVEPGHLVTVPLRGRPTYGVVVELSDTTPVEATLPITRVMD